MQQPLLFPNHHRHSNSIRDATSQLPPAARLLSAAEIIIFQLVTEFRAAAARMKKFVIRPVVRCDRGTAVVRPTAQWRIYLSNPHHTRTCVCVSGWIFPRWSSWILHLHMPYNGSGFSRLCTVFPIFSDFSICRVQKQLKRKKETESWSFWVK